MTVAAKELPVANPPPLAGAMVVIIAAVVGCSLYANLSLLVKSPGNYRFFPPFERGVNLNQNDHLGAEYYSIAGALVAGRGYAEPFQAQTGPTAWMAPVLSWVLAGLRWAADGDKDIVIALFVLLQDLTLIGTGWLVVALARQTTGGVWTATLVYVAGLLYNFRLCFQFTHDCWIILAVLDLLIAGMVWTKPFGSTWRWAAGWGIFGGLCALTSPIAGLTWGVLALAAGWPQGRRGRLAVAVLAAGLTVTPWVVRNYLVFGRLIPVKSNLAFELYQSQCLRPDGLLRGGIFASHPHGGNNKERRHYARLGEMAYLDEKWDLFWEAVRANPAGFFERMGNRFLAATVLYAPFDRSEERRRPWTFRFGRWTYPLPFICLLVVLLAAAWRSSRSFNPEPPATGTGRCLATVAVGSGLDEDRTWVSAQWVVIGVYLAYLFPYVVISFYDRYKLPLIGAEVALIVWGLDSVKRYLFRQNSWDEPAAVIVEDDQST